MAESEKENDGRVVVAGAGPVGMTTALALHARGVPSIILEAESEDRDRPGSRAIYVHGSTLRTFERNAPGLGQRIADAGLVWPTRRTLWEGKEVFSRTYPGAGDVEGIPHFSGVSQVETEDFLHEALEERDIPIRWDSAVETVESGEDGVRVETDDGEEYRTDYVVGADGAGSRVRKEIGAEFEGTQSENTFVIIDVDEVEDDPLPLERVFHYKHPEVGGRNVLLVPFQGAWRVDIQCYPDDDPEYYSSDEVVENLIGAVLGDRYRDRVSWVSTYQFKQVVADTFVDEHRRVLLAGEAAHLFAPFGARGMNSGVADADLAASAVTVARAAGTDGVARHEVENYAAVREKAAEWNKYAAGEALAYLQDDKPLIGLKKRLAAKVAPYYEPVGEWLDMAPYGPPDSPPVAMETRY